MLKTKIHNVIAWIAVVLWMGLIFYLSHQPATESSQISGSIVTFFINTIERILPIWDIDWSGFHFVVRKSAHLMAYFILGMLLIHALRHVRKSTSERVLIALILCVIYAISDETHQLFIAGRSGEVRDVLIDSVGSIGGISIYTLVVKLVKRLKKFQSKNLK